MLPIERPPNSLTPFPLPAPRRRRPRVAESVLHDELARVLFPGDAALGANAAREVLERIDLTRAAGVEPAQLCAELGIAPAAARRLAAALGLARALQRRCGAARPLMRSPDRVARLLAPELRTEERECFVALLLDGKHRLKRRHVVSIGTLTASLVHPREVFREAIRTASAALVVAHNHPSGDPEPSAEDVEVTRRLHEAGKLLGIPLLDHVVLGEGRFVSLRERLGL